MHDDLTCKTLQPFYHLYDIVKKLLLHYAGLDVITKISTLNIFPYLWFTFIGFRFNGRFHIRNIGPLNKLPLLLLSPYTLSKTRQH